MKNLIFAFTLFTFISMSAQKDTYLVQGNLIFSNSKYDGPNTVKSQGGYFNILAKVGYQYSEKSTAGINLGFGDNNLYPNYGNNLQFANYTNQYATAGAFYRYSKKVSDLVTFYGEVHSNFNFAKEIRILNNSTETNRNTFLNLGITPAVFVNLHNNFGLNFSLGGLYYNQIISASENAILNSGNGIDLNFGTAFAIGVSKNF